MAQEISVDFNVLPRGTRERIAESTGPRPKLAPLFADPSSTGAAIFWWVVLGLACLFGLVAVVESGFGGLNFGADAVQSPTLLFVYFGAVFLLAAAGLGIAFQLQRSKALPFRPGRYLFPLDFVDARSRQLRIRSLSELVDFKAVHHHTNGGYTHTAFTFTFQGGGTEDFSVRSKDQAEAQLQNLQQSRGAFSKALEEQNLDLVHHYDLFFDVRTKGGFEAFVGKSPTELSSGLMALELPRMLERRWVMALAAGVVLGSGLWLVRNLISDNLSFAAAQREGSGDAYHSYLRTGWLHMAEAKELGAKVNFEECEQQETERCWNQYVSYWSESPRLQEARNERLPRAALKEASGTVSEVREFRKRYPDSVADADAKARIHELFTLALAEFQKQASTDNPALVPFVGKLLAHLEATENPRVLVRFRSEESASLQMADRILSEALSEEGKPMAKASPYFDDAHTRPLESHIAGALSKAFKEIFPTDLLVLEQGPALAAAKDVTDSSVPELGIVYTVAWSGASYRSEKGGRQFVGIEFEFDAGMTVPKEKPLNFSLTVHPPERFSVEYSRYMDRLGSSMGDEGPGDGLVYEIMALRAFDELGEKLGQVFFRTDSKAFLAGALGTPDEEGDEASAPPKRKAEAKKDSRRKKPAGTASSTPP